MSMLSRRSDVATGAMPLRGVNITLPMLVLLVLAAMSVPFEFKMKAGTPWWLPVMLAIGTTVAIRLGHVRLWGARYLLSGAGVRGLLALPLLLFLLFFGAFNRGVGIAMTALTGERFVETRQVEVRMHLRRGKSSGKCRYYISNDADVEHCIGRAVYERFQGQWIEVVVRGRRSSWGALIDRVDFPP